KSSNKHPSQTKVKQKFKKSPGESSIRLEKVGKKAIINNN
ncbi:15633_t:CDS:1, partial [Racocetra fulgida]